MKILNMIAADEEISQLKKELKEKTGQSLGFNYDCYTGIEDYKEHLQSEKMSKGGGKTPKQAKSPKIYFRQ